MPPTNTVITGVGVVSSIGIGAQQYFDALCAGTSGIRSLAERTDNEAKPARPELEGKPNLSFGGPVLDFDPKQFVRPRKALKVMSREVATVYAASQLAIEHACLREMLPASESGEIKPNDIATVFGGEILFGPPPEMIDPITDCHDDDGVLHPSQYGSAARSGLMPLWMLKYLPNMGACHVGISVNARGPNNSILSGDVSGPQAVIESMHCIERGLARLSISGASGTKISAMRLVTRSDQTIATASDPLAHSSRPFDPSSTGIVPAEGAASLVIENSEHAKSRNAKVLAKISGYAARFVGSSGIRSAQNRSVEPSERGSAQAIQFAIRDSLKSADLNAKQIDVVICHASGDPEMDAYEQSVLAKMFPNVAAVAPAASLGHTGAASGQIGMTTGALCIANQKIPMTLNSSQSQINLLAQTKPAEINHVLCLSHTSEGNAVAIVLSR